MNSTKEENPGSAPGTEPLNRSIPAWQWAVVAGFVIVSLLFVPDVRNSALVQSTWTAICAPFLSAE
ncbi:MAG: hypothetical protein NXI16_04715 [Alphaproteobacteria bacterium]|nr:hypothetical protein [Alphaproteobacteria bacterium]